MSNFNYTHERFTIMHKRNYTSIILSITFVVTSVCASSEHHESAVPSEDASELLHIDWRGLGLIPTDITDRRLLTFLKLAAHKAGYAVDDNERVQADWHVIKTDIQKDAATLYATYCPKNFWSRLVASSEACQACDLFEQLQKDELEETLAYTAMKLKGDTEILLRGVSVIDMKQLSFCEKFKLAHVVGISCESMEKMKGAIRLERSAHVAYALGKPIQAMLNPATSLWVFER